MTAKEFIEQNAKLKHADSVFIRGLGYTILLKLCRLMELYAQMKVDEETARLKRLHRIK